MRLLLSAQMAWFQTLTSAPEINSAQGAPLPSPFALEPVPPGINPLSYRGSTPFAALLPDVEKSAIPPKATARMAPPDIKSDDLLSQKEVLFPSVAELADESWNVD